VSRCLTSGAKKLEARKMLEDGDESHLSSAPWNDGGDHFNRAIHWNRFLYVHPNL